MHHKSIMLVAGARPNFIKIAPVLRSLARTRKYKLILVHTGQHYDAKLSKVFFDELAIPKPDINLEVGSGPHAVQTAKIMTAFDALLEKKKPDLVLVVGDVNSTIACCLAAAKRGIKIAHVEAGLRSFDWTMPEEINRVLTDRLSDFLFCTEPSAIKNLRSEGIDPKKVFFVGNVMIDTLLAHKHKAKKSKILKRLKLQGTSYGIVTLHRPGNVDDPVNLGRIIAILQKISRRLPLVFPVHPRTESNLRKWGISTKGIIVTAPFGYLDFLKLVSNASAVLTDSGGIQEETTILGVPCLTLRENTERPITVTSGTNHIVGMDEKLIFQVLGKVLKQKIRRKPNIKYWDGKASNRIAKLIIKWL